MTNEDFQMAVIGVVIALPGLAAYMRPVGAIERARLVERARESVRATMHAKAVSHRKYLSYFAFTQALSQIDKIMQREKAEQILAEAGISDGHEQQGQPVHPN